MKSFTYVFAAALGIAVALGTQPVRAAAADGWDALGVVTKLQNKVSALEARVAQLERGGPLRDSLAVQRHVIELERKLDKLEKQSGLQQFVVSEVPSAETHIPIHVKSQSEILQAFDRGMFVPSR